MKYKVGDKVRIKTWEALDEEFSSFKSIFNDNYILCGIHFTQGMENELTKLNNNRILTIEAVNQEDRIYHMEELLFNWTDNMIESVMTPELIRLMEPIRNRFEILDI
jgi:hypothetical protein